MNGGASSGSGTTTTTQEPWGPSTSFLKEGMAESQRLYGLGPAQYTPWSQVASFTPTQTAYQNGVTDYVNSAGTQSLMGQTGSAVNNLMTNKSGTANVSQYGVNNLAGYVGNNNTMDSGAANNRLLYGDTKNPYLQSNVQTALDQLSNNFKNNTLPSMRRAAIGNGTYGSSRNELAEATGAAQLNKDMYDTSSQMYSDDYARTESNRMGALQNNLNQQQSQMSLINQLLGVGQGANLDNFALGLGGLQTALQLPLNMLSAQGKVGDQQYAQTQNELNDATNRWNFDQNANWDSLAQYAKLISPTASLGGTSTANTTTLDPSASSSTVGNVAGGVMSLAGLLSALYGSDKTSPFNGTGPMQSFQNK